MTQLFDTALKDNNLFSSDPYKGGLSHTESHQVMLQLASSIDLQKIAQVFYRQLRAKLNLDGLTIKFSSGLVTLGEPEKSNNIKTLDQVSKHTIFATLVYSFSKVLSLREAAILNDLHRLFKFPLKNALEFHSVKQLALKDYLTSLGNRVHYQESLVRLLSQAKRAGEGFGLLVIDMDKFKAVNDTFGHHEGDKVLTATADVLRQSLRESDYAFRFGGDEFCCLLPGSDNLVNGKIAERIQDFMNKNPILAKHKMSCSIGSTMYQYGDTELSLFNRADKALYAAKQNGKNCYKVA
ncbi:GGDEF domain-containing protein [Aliiglaciecola sp. NS0011-25]|uniref:GGDEF domain-containing protein n=1 Tax=Aliiglaciecola sp. NS0011-25 TaxID=3127654 RepID=UPI00333EE410